MQEKKRTQSFFLTFEGGEGVGKSTQIRLLFEYLKSLGKDVVLTREPGGCPSAERIREAMLGGEEPLDSLSQLFLVMAARREHYLHTLKPALDAGKWVLCDRFIDSTLVYQGKEYYDKILRLHALSTDHLMPNLTLLFDMPPEISLARIQKRGIQNALDAVDITHHTARRQAYLDLSKTFPERICVINAQSTPETIQDNIQKTLQEKEFIFPR
jgi:dTMP kinase